jgi:hypothetical protein
MDETANWLAERLLYVANYDGDITDDELQAIGFVLALHNLQIEPIVLTALREVAEAGVIQPTPPPAGVAERDWSGIGRSLVSLVVDDVHLTLRGAAISRAKDFLDSLGAGSQIDEMQNLAHRVLMDLGEQAHRFAVLRNLYILAAADESIVDEERVLLDKVATELNAPGPLKSFLEANAAKLDFIAPDSAADKQAMLERAAAMIAADGVVDGREMSLGEVLVSRLGLGTDALRDAVTNAMVAAQKGTGTEARDLWKENRATVIAICKSFNMLPDGGMNLVRGFASLGQDLSFYAEVKQERAFFEFFWLMNVRAVGQDETMMAMMPTYLKSGLADGHFGKLQAAILRSEQAHGRDPIQCADLSLPQLKGAVRDFWLG